MGRSSNATIQGVIDLGHMITAWCQNARCGHHAVLDMLAMRDRLGPDHGAMHDDLVPLLRCSKCGGKKIGLTTNPGTTECGGNPYEKAREAR